MITHLEGRLALLDPSIPAVELDVNGVRFQVLVPFFLWPELDALAAGAELDDPVQRPILGMHIFYHVTQNNPVPLLVGFFHRAEREFFRKFTTVEGIGPLKAVKAMNVPVGIIARAIEQEDRATLAKLPGIGPRAADKAIATLRGKVTIEAAMHPGGRAAPVDIRDFEGGRIVEDAIAAVIALGYQRNDARRWVAEARERDPELDSVEALTLAVLRERGAR